MNLLKQLNKYVPLTAVATAGIMAFGGMQDLEAKDLKKGAIYSFNGLTMIDGFTSGKYDGVCDEIIAGNTTVYGNGVEALFAKEGSFQAQIHEVIENNITNLVLGKAGTSFYSVKHDGNGLYKVDFDHDNTIQKSFTIGKNYIETVFGSAMYSPDQNKFSTIISIFELNNLAKKVDHIDDTIFSEMKKTMYEQK